MNRTSFDPNWQLLHFLAVFYHSQENAPSSFVAGIAYDLGSFWLPCPICQYHFYTEGPAIIAFFKEEGFEKIGVAMSLWMKQNEVSIRTSALMNEGYDKRWPSCDMCPKCWKKDMCSEEPEPQYFPEHTYATAKEANQETAKKIKEIQEHPSQWEPDEASKYVLREHHFLRTFHPLEVWAFLKKTYLFDASTHGEPSASSSSASSSHIDLAANLSEASKKNLLNNPLKKSRAPKASLVLQKAADSIENAITSTPEKEDCSGARCPYAGSLVLQKAADSIENAITSTPEKEDGSGARCPYAGSVAEVFAPKQCFGGPVGDILQEVGKVPSTKSFLRRRD